MQGQALTCTHGLQGQQGAASPAAMRSVSGGSVLAAVLLVILPAIQAQILPGVGQLVTTCTNAMPAWPDL